MKKIRFIMVVAMLLALAGCASQSSRPEQAGSATATHSVRKQVMAIKKRLPHLKSVVGRWTNQRVDAAYKAYFDGATLVYLVETASGEQAGSYAVNKYYYAAQQLFYYHGHGSVPSVRGLMLQPVQLDVQLAFTGDGLLKNSTKTVDGRRAKMASREILAIKSHAKKLYKKALAKKRSSGS